MQSDLLGVVETGDFQRGIRQQQGDELEELLGCPVDLVTDAALSPYLREQVLATARPLEAA